MNNNELLLKLISEFAKDGEVSEIEKIILKEKATELGIDGNSLELLIQMELNKSIEKISNPSKVETHSILQKEISKKQVSYDFVVEGNLGECGIYLKDENDISKRNLLNEKFKFYFNKGDSKSKEHLISISKDLEGINGNHFKAEYFAFFMDVLDFTVYPEYVVTKDQYSNALFHEIIEISADTYPFITIVADNITFNEHTKRRCIFKMSVYNKEYSCFLYDNVLEYELLKLEIASFFKDKFTGDWWEIPDFDIQKMKQHEEEWLEEKTNNEKSERILELRILEEEEHALKLKRIEEEESIKLKVEKERLDIISKAEQKAKDDERYQQELDEIYKQRKEREDKERRELEDSYNKTHNELNETLSSKKNKNSEYNSHERKEFSSSVSRGGDILNPDRIIIENGNITWTKRSKILIGSESITIPLDKVASVELKTAIVGTDIIIRSNGRGSIHAENFATSDAKEIKSLLGY